VFTKMGRAKKEGGKRGGQPGFAIKNGGKGDKSIGKREHRKKKKKKKP